MIGIFGQILANGGGGFWETSSDIIVSVFGFVILVTAIIVYFKGGSKAIRKVISLAGKAETFIGKATVTIDNVVPDIVQCTKRATKVMQDILPDVLEDLERKDPLPLRTGLSKKCLRIAMSDLCRLPQSQRELNEKGKELLVNSGIQQIIDDNIDSFISELEQVKVQNYLDLESECYSVLQKREDPEVTNKLKNFAYNNPESTLEEILFAGSIYLRDKFIEKHPSLTL